MVNLKFSYRSTKPKAHLRLRYRSYYIPTQIEVKKDFWSRHIKGTKFKADNETVQRVLIDKTTKLKDHVMAEIERAGENSIDKEFLERVVREFYNPPIPEPVKDVPKNLMGYFDYYINNPRMKRGKPQTLSPGTIKKITTVKNRINERLGDIQMTAIDDNYRNRLYNALQGYAPNTIEGTMKEIKTLCIHAQKEGIEIKQEVLNWELSYGKSDIVYLNFDEIGAIKKLDGLPDYLDNARDWLIISCYTGQRVSDFLRFDKSMIERKQGKKGKTTYFLNFSQQKTGNEMRLPLHKEVLSILDKRNGDFPRAISDVKYNAYIKEVAKRAKLTQPTKGSIKTKTAKGEYRQEEGTYPKWKLISSHIGRRSYCTNYFGKIPTDLLMFASGHSREATFLTYVRRTKDEKADRLAKYF